MRSRECGRVRVQRSGFCVRCNRERPLIKAYPLRDGRPGRYRVWSCMSCMDRVQIGRWRANPTRDDTGRLRQSESEAAIGIWLAQEERAGRIRDLRRCNDQPRETYRLDLYGTREVEEILVAIERSHEVGDEWWARAQRVRESRRTFASYTPDYSWTDADSGRRHVLDAKGSKRTDARTEKIRMLMRLVHGIEVEIGVPTASQRRAAKDLTAVYSARRFS